MATTVHQRLLERTRMELGDLPQPFDFAFVGDGERDHFNVEHRPFDETSIVLRRDGQVVDPASVGVTFDGLTGTVIFADGPPPGIVWEIEGMKWRYFSDEDLNLFIDTAVAQHSHNRADGSGGSYSASDIPPVEEYPVALYATIQALWALATDAAFDIDILAPDGVNIPRSERYRQLMEMIGARQTQYDEISAALNIGIKRMETLTVRRTAKLTNRLVPVYLPSEYDDRTRPKRVLFPPMLQGTAPIKINGGTYDIDITTGDPWSVLIDLSFDLTGCEVKNEIRRTGSHGYSGTVGPPVLSFDQTIVDAPNGIMRLSLSGERTRKLPYNALWELQIAQPGEEPRTKLRGLVRASNSEVVR